MLISVDDINRINSITDQKIDYNDEIVSIEDVGELETIDISVSGDSLFYCNDILTKNSAGTNMTADFMVGVSSSEQLAELNQLMFKQLGKNRYFDSNSLIRAVVGVDRMKMRLYNCDDSAQTLINDDKPVIDSGKFFTEEMERSMSGKKFGKDMFNGFS